MRPNQVDKKYLWNIHGKACTVSGYGDALILRFWIDGVAYYGEFGCLEAIYAYVSDRGVAWDAYEVEVTEVIEYREAA